ncbi:MAG: Cystathionine beta-lyase, type II, partial [uncultured Blastococcus sp.]
RQPPAPGRAARRTAAGRPLDAARGHLPGLARLPRPGPADHGREVLPRAGRGGDGRRTRVRRPWSGARPAQLRDPAPGAHHHRRADGRRRATGV